MLVTPVHVNWALVHHDSFEWQTTLACQVVDHRTPLHAATEVHVLCRKLPLHALYRDAVELKHKHKPHLQSLKRGHHQWWYAASRVVSCLLTRLLKAAVFVHTHSSSDMHLGSAVQPDSPAFQKSVDVYRQLQTGTCPVHGEYVSDVTSHQFALLCSVTDATVDPLCYAILVIRCLHAEAVFLLQSCGLLQGT